MCAPMVFRIRQVLRDESIAMPLLPLVAVQNAAAVIKLRTGFVDVETGLDWVVARRHDATRPNTYSTAAVRQRRARKKQRVLHLANIWRTVEGNQTEAAAVENIMS